MARKLDCPGQYAAPTTFFHTKPVLMLEDDITCLSCSLVLRRSLLGSAHLSYLASG